MVNGFDTQAWEAAKKQVTEILIEVARSAKGHIFYSDLATRISAIKVGPRDAALNEILDEVSSKEDAAGRGLLSAVVIRKPPDMLPGEGFFKLAKSRGRNINNRTSCWIGELRQVQDYWRRTEGDAPHCL